MQNYVQRGDRITVPAAPAALESGEPVLIGSLFGIACGPVESGAEVVLATVGVFEIPKTSALAIDQGDAVYWDVGEAAVNKTAADNYLVGYAVEDAANPSAMCKVRLAGIPAIETYIYTPA